VWIGLIGLEPLDAFQARVFSSMIELAQPHVSRRQTLCVRLKRFYAMQSLVGMLTPLPFG